MRLPAILALLFCTLFLVGCSVHSSPTKPDSSKNASSENEASRVIVGQYQKVFAALTDVIEKQFNVYSINYFPESGNIKFRGRGAAFRGVVEVSMTIIPVKGLDISGKSVDGYSLDIISTGAGFNASMAPGYAINNIYYELYNNLTKYELVTTYIQNPNIQSIDRKNLANEESTISGSGFAVDTSGHIITNAHVVDKTKSIFVVVNGNKEQASIVKIDTANDLALLKINTPVKDVLRIRMGKDLRSGDDVVVAGFPMSKVLSSDVNISTGTISAMSGPEGDTRLFQISAPVIPGNSGGPVLDRAGSVSGVIVNKLNTLNTAKQTGDTPQNINFAINLFFLKAFLETNGVAYVSQNKSTRLEAADVADIARKGTFFIICER